MADSAGVLPAVYEALCDHFGQIPLRASVSFLGVDPIEVLRFEPVPGELAYLTLGTARRPMTAAAAQTLADAGPRAELMLHLRAEVAGADDVWRRLAVLGAAPSVEGVVYIPGMTVDIGEPMARGMRCTGIVVSKSAVGPVTTGAGAVDIMQVIPATPTELAWCRVHGADAMVQRWTDQRVDLLDIGRPSAALD